MGTNNPWLDKNDPLIKDRFKRLKEKLAAEKRALEDLLPMNKRGRSMPSEKNKKASGTEQTNSPLTPDGFSSVTESPSSTSYKLRKRKELPNELEEPRHIFRKPSELKNKKARTCLFKNSESPDEVEPAMSPKNDFDKAMRSGDGKELRPKSSLSERFDKFKAKIQQEPKKLSKKGPKPIEKGKSSRPVESTNDAKVPKMQPFKIPRGRPRKISLSSATCDLVKSYTSIESEPAKPKPVNNTPLSPATKPKETSNKPSVPSQPKTVASKEALHAPQPSLTFTRPPVQKHVPSETTSPWSAEDTSSLGVPSPLAVPLEVSQPYTHVPSGDQLEAMDVEWVESVATQPEETMDWEVNVLRKEIKDSSEPTSLSTSLQLAPSVTTSYNSEIILVLDSNVLISALSFVERMLATPVPGLGFPVFYIPHRVLNELDGLKECKQREVYKHARKAIEFLNQKLAERHPRLCVQLLKDYISSSHDTYLNSDDKILLCCLQAKEMGVGRRVVLLSNDLNLRNKAIVEDLETFSVTDFENVIMTLTEDIRLEELNYCMLYYKLKSLLNSVFEEILHAECRINSSKTKLTLNECIQFFVRRWQPWFCKIVTITAEESLVQLRNALKSDEESSLMPILIHGVSFLSCFAIRTKPYFSSVKKGLANLQLISSRAKSLVSYSPPEEKDYIGNLAEIFKECVDALEIELKKIIAIPSSSTDCEKRFELLRGIIKSIPASLEAILEKPILLVDQCTEISKLAGILAENSLHTKEAYSMLLSYAATKENGRDTLEKANVMFKRAIDRCNHLLKARKMDNPSSLL